MNSMDSHIFVDLMVSSDQVKNVDWISKLPDTLLLIILSRLPTEEAIRTSVLSKQWKHVWKELSHLVFNMPSFIDSTESLDDSNQVVTEVLNTHHGHLKSCVINHYSHQGVNGMLNTWIQLVTCVKHTKSLTLRHHKVPISKPLNIALGMFSHPSLTSLSLHSYNLESSNPLRNLKTLKLISILVPEVRVFNKVLPFCPSLEVLVLSIHCMNKGQGPLKIENNKLKLLQVSSTIHINGIEVSATSLYILFIENATVSRGDFIIQSPKIQFNQNFWKGFSPHISYNISKEENNIEHKELVNLICESSSPFRLAWASFSVSIDLMNATEVERLRQVLSLSTHTMIGLEIIFKDNNATKEEKESWHKKFNKDVFPNIKFRVIYLWMYNFSGSDEEFAFASGLIKQRAVVNKMMIKTPTSFTHEKMLQAETAVVNKLYALRREYQRELIIECL